MLGRQRRRISNNGEKSDEGRSQRNESGSRRGIEKEMGNGKEEKVHNGVRKKDEENSEKKIGLKERKGEKKDIGAIKEKKDHESSETKRSHIGRRNVKRRDSGQRMEDGCEGGLVKGLLLPQNVPVTSIHFRPGDKTTYLLGTSSGEVLLVSGCRLLSFFFLFHTY